MNRTFGMALLVATVLTATGCRSDDTVSEQSVPSASSSPPTSASPSTPPPPPSTAEDTVATTGTAMPVDCGLPADGAHQIDVGGVSRQYVTVAPTAPMGPRPTVVLLHGFASSAAEFVETSGMAALAPQAGVLVVAPQGLGEPAGWEVGNWGTDVAFVHAVLDDLASCIDAASVWVGGHSAGSAFAAALGCGDPARVEGMVLNAGLAPPLCSGDTPATVIVHGTNDPVVAFGGGAQGTGSGSFQLDAVPMSAGKWATGAGCAATPVERRVEPDVAVTEWAGCATGSFVRLLAVQGGGHVWAGALGDTGPGTVTRTISSSCLLLAGAVHGTVDLPDVPDCPDPGPIPATT